MEQFCKIREGAFVQSLLAFFTFQEPSQLVSAARRD